MKNLSSQQHFIGCDVSKGTLDFAIFQRNCDYRKFAHIRVPNSVEGFQQMRKWLRSFNIKMKECVIAMEHTGAYSNALAEWCFKKGVMFVLLHPLDVKNASARGRNKTDKEDAQFIADYVYTMREKLSPSSPEAPVIKRLRELKNERELAVKARSAYLCQIKTIESRHAVARMEKCVKALTDQIKSIEKSIKEALETDEGVKKNYSLLLSIPGIGMVNAVATIIATGNFTRFQTARQYAKFICVAPLSKVSGDTIRGGDHIVRAGHGEIKSLLTEGARSAIHHDRQLRAYYERKRLQGKSHGCVMNAVKFKLICRMFAVVGRQRPYVDTEGYRS